ncbi:MAG: SH3 domain-containing C40 family peptidase, partial [Bacilli bacterium]
MKKLSLSIKGLSLSLCVAMMGTLFTPVPHAANASGVTATNNTEAVISVDKEWLRKSPSSDANAYGYLIEGRIVTVLDQVNEDWIKIQYKNYTGYIRKSAILEPESDQTTVDDRYQETITTKVGLKKSASSSSSAYGYLIPGREVTVLDQVNSSWLKVQYKYYVGYIEAYSVKDSVSPAPEADSFGDKVITSAEKYLGTPYRWGSSKYTTETFDCSSFVQRVFAENGITLARGARGQAQDGSVKIISRSELKKGDLV